MRTTFILALLFLGSIFVAANEPITITSEGGAQPNADNSVFLYFDKVEFSFPKQGIEIRCDRLKLEKEAPPVGKSLRATATGNVVVRKRGAEGKQHIATGQKAVFDFKTNETKLSGEPPPQIDLGGGKIMTADKIIFRENGIFKLDGNARTVFRPKKEQG
jgi:lipopolysaccharide export system protein LptA